MARVLVARGWTAADAELPSFLSPMLKSMRSPFELSGMQRAIDRTARAVRHRESICVYGDYDVDGVASSALMVGLLRFLGCDPRVFVPHRFRDGYGMTVRRVEEIAAAGCTLIVTVDTGITAVEPIRRAGELGMDVVVTDHHLAGEELPPAAALVNPNFAEDMYPHGRLCGVGVAFKFAHALLRHLAIPEAEAKRFLLEQLDLVALGTIADVVPLLGENRVFARHGLDAIANSRRPGLRALLEVARVAPGRFTTETVAFVLGPRLNAPGRTGDAMDALELLLTQDATQARRLAQQLDALNRERRQIEEDILQASLEEAESLHCGNRDTLCSLVVGGAGWHLGVVGIVAARLTERYDVPAIVLALEEDMAKGSARSVPGFDIHEALSCCAEHLVTYGGHAAAAGLKLRAANLPGFREALNQHASQVFTRLDRDRTVDVDAELQPGDFGWDLHRDVQRLQPFGEGNPCPVFMVRGAEAVYMPRVVGSNHLRVRVRHGSTVCDAIGFSLAGLKEFFEGGQVDLLFRPRENTWNGSTNLEMELLDARPAAGA